MSLHAHNQIFSSFALHVVPLSHCLWKKITNTTKNTNIITENNQIMLSSYHLLRFCLLQILGCAYLNLSINCFQTRLLLCFKATVSCIHVTNHLNGCHIMYPHILKMIIIINHMHTINSFRDYIHVVYSIWIVTRLPSVSTLTLPNVCISGCITLPCIICKQRIQTWLLYTS